MEIYERLKSVRKDDLHLNQKEFADALGITIASYSFIETGKRKIKDRHIRVLAMTYHINEQWLRYGEGNRFTIDPTKAELLNIFDMLESKVQDHLMKSAKDLLDLQHAIRDTENRNVDIEDIHK